MEQKTQIIKNSLEYREFVFRIFVVKIRFEFNSEKKFVTIFEGFIQKKVRNVNLKNRGFSTPLIEPQTYKKLVRQFSFLFLKTEYF